MVALAQTVNPPRFPPPWSLEEPNDACFVARDNNGQQLRYALSNDGRVGADRRFAASGMTSANYMLSFRNTTQAPPAAISLRQSFSR
jgi:hypothetical protein